MAVPATLTADRCGEQVDHMSYFPEAYGAKISDSDIGRLRSVLTAVEPVADIIQLRSASTPQEPMTAPEVGENGPKKAPQKPHFFRGPKMAVREIAAKTGF